MRLVSSRFVHGFTIVELIVTMLLIGILATAGSMKFTAATTDLRQEAEAARLLACLRWLREMARTYSPASRTGYGIFFWKTPASGGMPARCISYSPYTPRPTPGTSINYAYRVPADPKNSITPFRNMGGPQDPIYFGLLTPAERDTTPIALLGNGLEIYFQSDSMGVTDWTPATDSNWPEWKPTVLSTETVGFNRCRIVFWPPMSGAQASLTTPWPINSPRYSPPRPWGGGEKGPTLPDFITSGWGSWWDSCYNRIYIRTPLSSTDPNHITGSPPIRIQIHPGLGTVRLMPTWERRSNNTW